MLNKPEFVRTTAEEVIHRLGDVDEASSVRDGFALSDQLVSVREITGDVVNCVANAFHDGITSRAVQQKSHSSVERT